MYESDSFVPAFDWLDRVRDAAPFSPYVRCSDGRTAKPGEHSNERRRDCDCRSSAGDERLADGYGPRADRD
jgi:hypothetical protein